MEKGEDYFSNKVPPQGTGDLLAEDRRVCSWECGVTSMTSLPSGCSAALDEGQWWGLSAIPSSPFHCHTLLMVQIFLILT